MRVFPEEELLGEPCFPHFVVASSLYHSGQEVESSLFLPVQEESNPHRTLVDREIFQENRVLLALVQNLHQWVQDSSVLLLLFPQISARALALDEGKHLEEHEALGLGQEVD